MCNFLNVFKFVALFIAFVGVCFSVWCMYSSVKDKAAKCSFRYYLNQLILFIAVIVILVADFVFCS